MRHICVCVRLCVSVWIGEGVIVQLIYAFGFVCVAICWARCASTSQAYGKIVLYSKWPLAYLKDEIVSSLFITLDGEQSIPQYNPVMTMQWYSACTSKDHMAAWWKISLECDISIEKRPSLGQNRQLFQAHHLEECIIHDISIFNTFPSVGTVLLCY